MYIKSILRLLNYKLRNLVALRGQKKISKNAAITTNKYGFTKQKHIRGDKTVQIQNFGPNVIQTTGRSHLRTWRPRSTFRDPGNQVNAREPHSASTVWEMFTFGNMLQVHVCHKKQNTYIDNPFRTDSLVYKRGSLFQINLLDKCQIFDAQCLIHALITFRSCLDHCDV